MINLLQKMELSVSEIDKEMTGAEDQAFGFIHLRFEITHMVGMTRTALGGRKTWEILVYR